MFAPDVFRDLDEFFAARPVRELTMLVAVSGGADSVFLLRAIHEWHSQIKGSGKLVVVHVNHQLRGEASDQDAEFVADLSRKLDLPCCVESLLAPSLESNQGNGLEANLRALRYQVLERVAAKFGARYVATGHTANDQVETVLFRILRGTGVDGLSGIPATRKINDSLTVIRPLLNFEKARVLEQLRSIGQEFREDESNSSDAFTRNRIRNDVLPVLRQAIGNDIDRSILNLASLAAKQTTMLQTLAGPMLRECFRVQKGTVVVDLQRVLGREEELVKVALRSSWSNAGLPTNAMNSSKWDELAAMVLDNTKASPPKTFPGNIRVCYHGNSLRIGGAGDIGDTGNSES